MIKGIRNNKNKLPYFWYLHTMQGISSPVHNEDELYNMGKVTFRVTSNSVIMYHPHMYQKSHA